MLPAQLDNPDSVVLQAQPELLDQLDQPENVEQMDQEDTRDMQEPLVFQDLQDKSDQEEILVHLANLAAQAHV